MTNLNFRFSDGLFESVKAEYWRRFFNVLKMKWCERRTSSVYSGEAVYSIISWGG